MIKVFSVGPDFSFQVIKAYEGIVDYFLFDTKGALRGGNGEEFDWQILKNYPSNTPFFSQRGNWPGTRQTDRRSQKPLLPHRETRIALRG